MKSLYVNKRSPGNVDGANLDTYINWGKSLEAFILVSEKKEENTASKRSYINPWISEPESLVKVQNV